MNIKIIELFFNLKYLTVRNLDRHLNNNVMISTAPGSTVVGLGSRGAKDSRGREEKSTKEESRGLRATAERGACVLQRDIKASRKKERGNVCSHTTPVCINCSIGQSWKS